MLKIKTRWVQVLTLPVGVMRGGGGGNQIPSGRRYHERTKWVKVRHFLVDMLYFSLPSNKPVREPVREPVLLQNLYIFFIHNLSPLFKPFV